MNVYRKTFQFCISNKNVFTCLKQMYYFSSENNAQPINYFKRHCNEKLTKKRRYFLGGWRRLKVFSFVTFYGRLSSLQQYYRLVDFKKQKKLVPIETSTQALSVFIYLGHIFQMLVYNKNDLVTIKSKRQSIDLRGVGVAG